MSIKVIEWVFSSSSSRPTQRLVLLAIAEHSNDDGTNAYPATSTLAAETGLTERGVRKAITELEELGELAVEYKAGPKGCNRFRVLMHNDDGSIKTRNHVPGTRNTVHSEPCSADPEPCSSYPERGSSDPEPCSVDPERGSPEPSLTVQEPSLNRPEPSGLFDPPPADPPPKKRTRAKARQPLADDDPDWSEFWQAYPKRVKKATARIAWAKALDKATTADIIAGAKRYAEVRRGEDPQFTQHPATWLNAEGWADEHDPKPTTARRTGKHEPYQNDQDRDYHKW